MLIIQRPTVEAIGEEEGNRQRFAIGPLEPGFGHTLGNSLRRTLLSSIPGAAVTQVRFDDALHEFTTLPGVKEDVTDIILNLKDVVLRVDDRRPGHPAPRRPGPGRRHRRRHPADQRRRDPQPRPGASPRLNAKGRLAVDITVERGRGYVSADRNKRSSTIGVIPVDSIFSPVRRVAFTVEPTRVEQSTNFDRLVLDIETDGSISPREALASAGDTLRSLVGLVADMSDAPRASSSATSASPAAARPTWTCPSRTWTCPSGPATASSGPRSTPSASWSPRPRTTCWPSPTSARSRSTRCCRSSTSGAWPCATRRASPWPRFPAAPRRAAASAATPPTRRPCSATWWRR